MRLADFDYELPRSQIAQRPAPRGASRLLVLDAAGDRRHRRITDLPAALAAGDLMVINDTRVIPARLEARAGGGGRVDLLLVERLAPRRWLAMARPGRRLRPGSRLMLTGDVELEVEAVVGGGLYRLAAGAPLTPLLERLGHVPLPPYIERPDDETDRQRYQTVWARHPGSVAAPTAGLHFDRPLLTALGERGVEIARLTLHVGPGTFQPIRGERIDDHRMLAERFRIPEATAAAVERARRRGGRVLAVGTTVTRALEGVAGDDGLVRPGAGRTELFIRPGYRFRVVDLLLTNFHLPRSTLLLLVCAFAGRQPVLAAYREAVAEGYRFYSYGDAMLLARRSAAHGEQGGERG